MDGNFGYPRDDLDRFVRGQDSSVASRFQQKYWRTKQTLIKVTGKKEDEHVVASDANLDAKLEVFHSVQRTCMELLKVTEQYQRRICLLSQEESELGRFLRSQGSQDKSRAGKIMQATGKALCFSSQQRMALRKPLGRLYQEVETFRYRAISDTWLTVNRMEQSRTAYRGALLWMKDVSQELDPDTHKQMEKFRKVQAQVRSTKASFDKLKSDVCQKVELLGASRCNLLSHVLTAYQTTLLHFWEKTSHTMAAIHESFRGCPQNERRAPKMLEEATEKPSEKEKGRKNEEGAGSPEQQLFSTVSEGSGDEAEGEPAEEKDSLAFLSEILGALGQSEDGAGAGSGFSREWAEAFGSPEAEASAAGGAPADTQQAESFFLPSWLLDQSLNKSSTADPSGIVPQPVAPATAPAANQNLSLSGTKDAAGTGTGNLSAWFHLFADLDPLSNPDAVGRGSAEQNLHTV